MHLDADSAEHVNVSSGRVCVVEAGSDSSPSLRTDAGQAAEYSC